MNTNPNAKTILCYGDSNTWGKKPDAKSRFAADVRWTGVLQAGLGEDYYVIEEGLNSRTTNLEFAAKPGRNGKTYLVPCLDTHNPLDLVILMLGTNDLKIEYNRSALEVAAAIEELVEIIQTRAVNEDGIPIKILLVSPILIRESPHLQQQYSVVFYDHQSAAKSSELALALEAVAKKVGCSFVDAATVAEPGIDGIHLTEASHKALGEVLITKVREMVV